MAHGSKRWIKDYRGRMKRSRHRTKQDFLADIPFVKTKSPRSWSIRHVKKADCPQCRYLQKLFAHENDWYWEQTDAHLAEFKRRYARWLSPDHPQSAYIKDRSGWVREVVHFWTWERKHYPDMGRPWQYESRTMLCFKCELREDLDRNRWHLPYPGRKANLGWSVKNERRKYRAQVRNAIARGEYEDILPPRHAWLD